MSPSSSTPTPASESASHPAPHAAENGVLEVQPYLFFGGRCEEAINFYREAVGAKVIMMLRFKDAPAPADPNSECGPHSSDLNKIMHATLQIGGSSVLVSDGAESQLAFQGFGLSLIVSSEAEADSRFAALSDGGEVRAPLEATFFSPKFGVLADRFGVQWMVYVEPTRQG